jgi:hypothetical protein
MVRGPNGQIVLFETFECTIYNTKEATMSEPGSQFLCYEWLDVNCFVLMCAAVTCKSH